ncbi:hypothetical protein BC827DRAFT_466498 [Russula dissimulans]|nr:hypothetical protein BC827DRAFT_466498 [Russula dissimulans]
MSILSLVPFIIIAISAPALALGNPGYIYHPSYYPPHNPSQQDSPPDRNDYLGGAKLDILDLHRPTSIIPTEARPPYAPPAYAPPVYGPPAYGPPAAYAPPTYHPAAVPMIPVQPPPVRPDEAYDFLPKTPTYKPPADIPAYQPPAENQAYQPPVENQAHKPSAETPAYNPPEEATTTATVYSPTSTVTAPTETPSNAPAEETATMSPPPQKPTPPRWGHGKPSPLPNYKGRRNALRVPRQKVGKAAKSTSQREGPIRRLSFLKKRQQGGQHTVDLIPGIGHAPSISSVPTTTTTEALPPSQSHFGPEVKVDTSQEALSLHSNPEATMQSVGAMTPPVSSSGGHHHVDLDTGEPRDKAAVIASILSIIIGLVVIITIVKLTSNVLRKRRHARMLDQYDDHLCSKEGLIQEMGDHAHFETHDVIITSPDGSEISPLTSSRENSPSPPPFVTRAVGGTPPPLPMPTFAPPPTPASPLSLPFVKLLSPTVNLAQQNLTQSRASATSETMSMSTTSTSTSTDMSERRSASDGEGLGRQLSHRRMRSAPGSVVWSARSSSTTGKLTSGLSGDHEEGYWESVDVCGSESVGRMGCRRSVAMSVTW